MSSALENRGLLMASDRGAGRTPRQPQPQMAHQGGLLCVGGLPGAETAWKSPGFYRAGMVLSPSFISLCMLALDQGLSRELGPEPSQRVGETQPELTKTRLSRVRVGGQSNGHETARLFVIHC